jgi:[protein-PII] uridylyltransferase
MTDAALDRSRAAVIKQTRVELSRQVIAGELAAADLPARYAHAVDTWLAELLEQATGGKTRGYALVAVGGYGRRELSPASDLDLVLVYRRHRHVEEIAQKLWYTIWDTGIKLDHSVRSRSEVLTMAKTDLRVVLGWLDGRVVAGDERVAEPLFGEVQRIWRRQFPEYFDALVRSVETRHKSSGELAFLLEPDLKQAAGGLRDMAVLDALGKADERLAPFALDEANRKSRELLLAARVAVQSQTQSATDRLALQEQDQVATILGFSDADALMAAVAGAARTIAVSSAEAWRRAESIVRPRDETMLGTQEIEAGILVKNGEIVLSDDADVANDPTFIARVARAAAQRHAVIARATLDRLEAESVAPSEPWSADLRRAFIELLGTGDALVPAIETLDQRRLFELLVPEWSAVRNKPQRNAYHRYTVDRHLLEAIARAGQFVSRVDRADLLLLGALFHDIGKGFPGDHSEVGKEIARTIATRMGYPQEDVEVLVRVVAYHLLLPEIATRRDLDDPSTATLVARLIEDRQTLMLLAALSEADGLATGTSAWGSWKAELVTSLVERVGKIIDGHPVTPPPQSEPSAEERALLEAGKLALRVTGKRVTVVAPDQPGLLAAVTGALALNGCNVKRATAAPGVPGMAIEIYDVEPTFDREPKWEAIEADVARALAGETNLDERLAAQDRTYARGRKRASARPSEPQVMIDNETSALSSILEVRAPDRLGLLHAITRTLTDAGLDVNSAIVDTLGHEVIDTFYVRERLGQKISDERLAQVKGALVGVLNATAAD